MERKERIISAFGYLKSKGMAHTQADVAERMGATRPNVSAAFSGEPKLLTDRFMLRFNKAYGNIFSDEWLLAGEGEMLHASVVQTGDNNNNQQGDGNEYNSSTLFSKALDDIKEAHSLIKKQQELTENAQKQVSKSQEQIDLLLAMMAKIQG